MSAKIIQAISILNEGGLVAFPTETVYGLGADASNQKALEKIFIAKERPFNHPLIVHIAKVEEMANWARDIPQVAYQLANLFWPGPLTLILKKQPHVLDIITADQETIGLRIPSHPLARALISEFGRGIAAPSANKFTHVSPTTAQAVYEELGDKVDMILDGGECEVGLESTIIDLSGDTPAILRPGMINRDALTAALGRQVSYQQQSIIPTPGMHHLHYAPLTQTHILSNSEIKDFIKNIDANVAIIACESDEKEGAAKLICLTKNPAHYAHYLYQTLRSLDNSGVNHILIEKVPETTEWEAIRDRINKAAAKRT